MFFGVETDNKRWDINDLFAHTNMSLAYEDSSMMDGFSQAVLEDLKSVGGLDVR